MMTKKTEGKGILGYVQKVVGTQSNPHETRTTASTASTSKTTIAAGPFPDFAKQTFDPREWDGLDIALSVFYATQPWLVGIKTALESEGERVANGVLNKDDVSEGPFEYRNRKSELALWTGLPYDLEKINEANLMGAWLQAWNRTNPRAAIDRNELLSDLSHERWDTSPHAGCRVPAQDNFLRNVDKGRYTKQYIHDYDLKRIEVKSLRWKESDNWPNPDDNYECDFLMQGPRQKWPTNLAEGWVKDPHSTEASPSYWRWYGCKGTRDHTHWIRLRRDQVFRAIGGHKEI